MKKYIILFIFTFLLFSCWIDQEYQTRYDIYKTLCQNRWWELRFFNWTYVTLNWYSIYLESEIFCYKWNDFLYIEWFDFPSEIQLKYYNTILPE